MPPRCLELCFDSSRPGKRCRPRRLQGSTHWSDGVWKRSRGNGYTMQPMFAGDSRWLRAHRRLGSRVSGRGFATVLATTAHRSGNRPGHRCRDKPRGLERAAPAPARATPGRPIRPANATGWEPAAALGHSDLRQRDACRLRIGRRWRCSETGDCTFAKSESSRPARFVAQRERSGPSSRPTGSRSVSSVSLAAS